MREALTVYNVRRQAEGKLPLRIGIGVNTGDAVVGNIGSVQRMEYTIIGDVVNTTQRVEDLTKEFAWDILITDLTYPHVAHLIEVAAPHHVTVRGRTSEMAVYPVIGIKPEARHLIAQFLAPASLNGVSSDVADPKVLSAVSG